MKTFSFAACGRAVEARSGVYPSDYGLMPRRRMLSSKRPMHTEDGGRASFKLGGQGLGSPRLQRAGRCGPGADRGDRIRDNVTIPDIDPVPDPATTLLAHYATGAATSTLHYAAGFPCFDCAEE